MSYTPVFGARPAQPTQPLYLRVRHLRPTAALRREPVAAEYVADDTPVYESDVMAGVTKSPDANRSGR